MKKSYVAFALSMAIMLSLAACGGPPPSEATPPDSPSAATQAPDAAGGSIAVDENLMTVDITLPASFFESEEGSEFDADDFTSEPGIKGAKENEDGSVTITLTKAKHRELLDEMAAQYEETFTEMINSEDTPYIKDITHTEDFGVITADVDRAAYEATPFDLTPFILGMSGTMYQVFVGGETRVEVILRDAETEETITSSVYPDDLGGNS